MFCADTVLMHATTALTKGGTMAGAGPHVVTSSCCSTCACTCICIAIYDFKLLICFCCWLRPCAASRHRFVLAAIKAAGVNVNAQEKKLNEPFDPYAD